MNSVIADTSFLLGLLDGKDKWHQRSVALYQSLKANRVKIVIFDCVANELISVVGKRFGESGRQEKFKSFAQEKLLPLISKDNIVSLYRWVNEWHDEIVKVVIDTSGKFNFHDALIQLGARKIGLEHIVSFDEDFDKVAGLLRIKEKKDVKKIVSQK